MTDFNKVNNVYMDDEEKNIREADEVDERDDAPVLTPEEEVPMSELTPEQMAYFMVRLSDKDQTGLPNASIGYQTYAMEDPEDAQSKEDVFTLSRAYARFTENMRLPGFAQIDIVFSGYADAELRMMWSRLEEYGRNCVRHPEKTWVFFINFLDSRSVIDSDYVLRASILSPVFWTLTRETPTMLAQDVSIKNNNKNIEEKDMQGGNVIRMLVPNTLLSFQYTESIDTEALKLERVSLDHDNTYLSNEQNIWNEEE